MSGMSRIPYLAEDVRVKGVLAPYKAITSHRLVRPHTAFRRFVGEYWKSPNWTRNSSHGTLSITSGELDA